MFSRSRTTQQFHVEYRWFQRITEKEYRLAEQDTTDTRPDNINDIGCDIMDTGTNH